MTLLQRDQENQDIGIEIGLKAMVTALRKYHSDKEAIYREIIELEGYQNVSREDVFKYL